MAASKNIHNVTAYCCAAATHSRHLLSTVLYFLVITHFSHIHEAKDLFYIHAVHNPHPHPQLDTALK